MLWRQEARNSQLINLDHIDEHRNSRVLHREEAINSQLRSLGHVDEHRETYFIWLHCKMK